MPISVAAEYKRFLLSWFPELHRWLPCAAEVNNQVSDRDPKAASWPATVFDGCSFLSPPPVSQRLATAERNKEPGVGTVDEMLHLCAVLEKSVSQLTLLIC